MLKIRCGAIVQIVFVTLLLLTHATTTHAQCSTEEMTAVFVVSGIYPGTDLQLDMMSVYPVGEATYPSHAEVEAALFETSPYPPEFGMHFEYSYLSSLEPFDIYWRAPGDLGGIGIVDSRTGVFNFVGTIFWMGYGYILAPTESSHTWEFLTGELAAEPAQVRHVENYFWSDFTSATDASLALLRQTDVLQSFSECGPYNVLSYIYTPDVGVVDPYTVKCIIIVSGLCGAPWANSVVANESVTWGSIKATYR